MQTNSDRLYNSYRLRKLWTDIRKRERNNIVLAKIKHGQAFDVFIRYAKSAHKRKIPFYLTVSDFYVLDECVCRYCGGAARGFDRVDNSEGYIKSNIATCCTQCNLMKHRYSEQDFLNKIAQICKWMNF